MTPGLIMDDAMNERKGNAILLGEFSNSRSLHCSSTWTPWWIGYVASPDLGNLGSCEFGSGVCLSTEGQIRAGVVHSTLLHSVSDVLLGGGNPEVARVDAPAVVTGMGNLLAGRNGPDEELVGESVGAMLLPIIGEAPVASPFYRAEPGPACEGSATSINLFPEALFHRYPNEPSSLILLSHGGYCTWK
jgi:hypothetical protein